MKRCHNCGGNVVQLAIPGRTWPFQGEVELLVPSDMGIPTCERCGEEWVNPELADKLDLAMRIQQQEAKDDKDG